MKGAGHELPIPAKPAAAGLRAKPPERLAPVVEATQQAKLPGDRRGEARTRLRRVASSLPPFGRA